MWIGIVLALAIVSGDRGLLCGNGQALSRNRQFVLLRRTIVSQSRKAWKYARLAKFIVGWGSHLYYWIYPGVMVGVMGCSAATWSGTLWPNFMSASNPGPLFMMALVAVVFSFAVAYIAHRGVNGSTAVNIAINVIQISALVVFAVMALGYRMNHPPGSVAWQFDSTSGDAYTYEFATTQEGGTADRRTIVRDANGFRKPKLDAAGKPVPFKITYPRRTTRATFSPIPSAQIGGGDSQHQLGVRSGHGGDPDSGGIRIGNGHGRRGQERQARRSHRRHHVSLLVQGAFCYLFEYFAANYFLNSGYTMQSATARPLPSAT
jgi:basic amino acid/polyamine antiporter, APA family